MEYLTAVRDSAQSLLKILDDILDFSKVEAGKLELERSDFSLRECITAAVRPLETVAQDKGLASEPRSMTTSPMH